MKVGGGEKEPKRHVRQMMKEDTAFRGLCSFSHED